MAVSVPDSTGRGFRRYLAIPTGAQWRRLISNLLIACLLLEYLARGEALSRDLFYILVVPTAVVMGRDLLLDPLRHSAVLRWMIAYLLAIIVTALVAPMVDLPLIGKQARFALDMAFFFVPLTWFLARQPAYLDRLLFALVVAGAAVALVNVVVFYGWQAGIGRPLQRLGGIANLTSVLGVNELGAIYRTMCVAAAALIASGPASPRRRALLWGGGLVLAAAALLTQSRGAAAAMVCGVAVAALQGRSRRVKIAAVAALLAGIAVLVVATPILDRFSDAAYGDRLFVWREFLGMAAARPWTGWGLAPIDNVIMSNGEVFRQAHDMILNAWIRGGLVATAPFVAMLATALWFAWRAGRELGDTRPLALLVPVLVAGSVDFSILASPLSYQWLIFWLPLAICAGAEMAVREHRKTVRPRSAGPAVA